MCSFNLPEMAGFYTQKGIENLDCGRVAAVHEQNIKQQLPALI
jgi:hypothetical protein